VSVARKTSPRLNGPQGNSTLRQQQLRNPNVAQLKKPVTVTVQAKQPPPAPPVYRPQPTSMTSQTKQLAPYRPGIKTGHTPAAPPVYQPNQPRVALQAKMARGQGQQIFRANPSVIQCALNKWTFTQVKQFVNNNQPQNNEDRDTYITRVVNAAGNVHDETKAKIQSRAGQIYDVINPPQQKKKKKTETEGPHPGWTVDKYGEVSTGYNRNSGGGQHRPKGRVWIDNNGDAWSEDKDEHAGAGYKKFTKTGTGWLYQGTYNMDLTFKNR